MGKGNDEPTLIADLLGPTPSITREEAWRALHALMDMADTNPKINRYWFALFDLTRALQLLQQGVVVPMLQPPKCDHRKRDPSGPASVKMLLAAGCVALERSGLSAETARRDVSKMLERRKIKLSANKPVTEGTLQRWCKHHKREAEQDRRIAELDAEFFPLSQSRQEVITTLDRLLNRWDPTWWQRSDTDSFAWDTASWWRAEKPTS